MIIKVTQEHINRGLKRSCHLCPIALAIAEALNLNSNWILVDGKQFFKMFREGEYEDKVHELPTIIVKWIDYFDSGIHVNPIEFELFL